VALTTNKYDVFVFADTPKGSLASSLDFVPGIVESIEVQIPGGHSGKTGIQIWYHDAQVLPVQDDVWFVGNKTRQKVQLTDPFPGGLGWRAEAYNNGKRNHTFYVIVEVDPALAGLLLPPVLLLREAGESVPAGTEDVGGAPIGLPPP
jgi:hypothetical protein